MSELTGRARNRASAASGAAAKAALDPAAEAGLPDLIAAEMAADDAVVRRTKDGWRVGDADLPDLTSAMVLADLISAELAGPENTAQRPAAPSVSNTTPAGATATDGPVTASTAPNIAAGNSTAASSTASGAGTRGARARALRDAAGQAVTPAQTAAAIAEAAPGGGTGRAGKAKAKGKSKDPAASETSKLRTTIGQLEHALTARVRVEQAIGVLAERHRIQPRQAFEQLRSAARNRGRRVIDIASDVVASATNPLLQLPDELSRPRSTGRQGRRSRQTPGVLSSE